MKNTVRTGNAFYRFKVREKHIVTKLDGPKRRSLPERDTGVRSLPVHNDVNENGRVWTFA